MTCLKTAQLASLNCLLQMKHYLYETYLIWYYKILISGIVIKHGLLAFLVECNN